MMVWNPVHKTMNLQLISYEDVAKYRSAAAKEHVSITDTKNTQWYLWPGVGFGALIRAGRLTQRLKGIYVFPEERGQGKGTQLTKGLIDIATIHGAMFLQAYALNPKFYESLGWRRTQTQLRSGAWKVVSP